MWELSNEQIASLSEENRKKYHEAANLMQCEGSRYWVRAHQILQSMGWVKRRREEGPRVCVSLVAPTDLKHLI
jgi:hypothetical protein